MRRPALHRLGAWAAVGLLTLTAAPLSGQAVPGHVYWVGFFQALPGQGAAYNRALADIAVPVLDELVKRKQMVSHVLLTRATGGSEYTHLVILEFPDQAALDSYDARLDAASQAVLHKAWRDAATGFSGLRRLVRVETFTTAAPPP